MTKMPSQPARLALILIVWMAGLGAAAQFGKVAVALPEFGAAYDVSAVWSGLLVSAVGLCGLLFGVAAGVIVDRVGLRRSLVAGLALGGVLSLFQAVLPPFPLLIALRLAEGVSHLAIVVAGPVLMSVYATDAERPVAMTLWSTFFAISFMLVALVAGPIIRTVGLQGFLAAHGIYLIVLAMVLRAVMAAPPPRERARNLTLGEWIALHVRIYQSPRIMAPGLGFVWYTMMYVALLAYLPLFLEPPFRSTVSGAMPFASTIVSLTLGLAMLRWLSPVLVVQIGFISMAIVALSLLPFQSGDVAFLVVAIVLVGVSGLIPGASFASLSYLNEDLVDRSHATGALAQLGNVGTTTGAPLLAWLVVQFGLAGLVGFVLALSFFAISIHAWLSFRRAHSTDS